MSTAIEQRAPSLADIDREIRRLETVGVGGHFPFAIDARNAWLWVRDLKVRLDELTSKAPAADA